ncbi:MAG: hypothetical protein QMD13_00690 [Candidatus Bathyarchaeia archaeon]|nr:hypothetical protein [Candidatus Bathyarchaeia archaeon]MDI6904000.1 hypothetical protein [Candidatus Bathyarchaeia archaeon]
MAEGEKRGLLSIGVFLVILVVCIILVPLGLDWQLVPPLIIALYGGWTIVLAGLRASNPQKYERGPFSTFALGLILIAIGGAWFFSTRALWLYSLAIILLVLGALAITAALKRK